MLPMQNTKISQQHVNPGALEVCRVLSQAGYQAYIVGGCVRDLLLGMTPKDWDITTDATPKEVMELFPKTIPTGLQHGTVTVVLGEGVENHFEVTTFRIEGAYTDGRRPEEVFFVLHVEQDLARRDLTINAIAYDPIADRIEDPFGGIQDLEANLIRAVGSPMARFQEDGLRIMRVARFAARFGYDVHRDTMEAMRENLDTLRKVSKERISDELSKTLMATFPHRGLDILLRTEALQVACPLLCKDGLWRRHGIECVYGGALETRLAFLYSNLPSSVAQEELTNLKFSTKEIKRVIFLLDLREKYEPFRKARSVERYKAFMAVIKNQSPDPWEYTFEEFKKFVRAEDSASKERIESFSEITVLSRKELQINGDDLIAAGMQPGPQIKKALDACYQAVLEDPWRNHKDILLKIAFQ